MEGILDKLDVYTRKWATTLTEDDIAHLLQAVYKLPGLLETLKISERSAVIGKTGEDKFTNICRNLPVNYKIQNTSKQGKRGDFIITYSYMGMVKRCLVDIKTYTSTIPKKEVDKFLEDLTFGSYDAGLILSYNSKFAGISDYIYIEEQCLPSGKTPILYLNSDDDLLIAQAIELIISKAVVYNNKHLNIERIESLIEHINNSLSSSADVRRLLSEMQTSVAKSIQRCQESLTMHETHIKKAVREMSSCVTKTMLQQITPPPIEARSDNINPDIKATVAVPDTVLQKMRVQDHEAFIELTKLQWDDIEYNVDNKYIAVLISKNMIANVSSLKTKTSVCIDFQEELKIPEEDFELLIYKVTKDNSFICQLNAHLVEFIKKYMSL